MNLVEGGHGTIIGTITAQRAAEQAHTADVEQAEREYLNPLQQRLAGLIVRHVQPITRVLPWEESIKAGLQQRLPRVGEYNTHATFTIQVGEGEEDVVDVKVSSGQYPDREHPQNTSYRVEPKGFDRVLKVEPNGLVVESTERRSDIPSDPVIGGKYSSWPAWSHRATTTEAQAYQELLDQLDKAEGENRLKVVGNTPDIIETDPDTHPQWMKDRLAKKQ